MFAAIFWMATAALTIAWGVTGGEWFGIALGTLIAFRAVLLCFVVGGLAVYPEQRLQARLDRLSRPLSMDTRLGDYLLDLLFIVSFGWLAQKHPEIGIPVLLLYVACVLLWEIMNAIIVGGRR